VTEARSDELLAFAAFVQSATGATEVATGGERIQSLWGGYGELVRVRLVGASRSTVVVKWARLPAHRFGESGASHARKCRSYDVETAFYERVSARCDDSCRVARAVGTRVRSGEWLLVLEDLDEAGFARRTREPRGADLAACLGWLASFHARFLGQSAEANGLWPVGTYWHLATRQDELRAASRHDPSWPSRATALDAKLRAARFTTLVHGDAKPANFCFADNATDAIDAGGGAAVAAVDFQYTGGGPGIVDVAYLLHGASPGALAASLDVYFTRLRAVLPGSVDAAALEAEWRGLFPVALADFERFLAGWHR
jgi:hypothetical protein